ncbi:MAG: hypothetical protein HZY79_00505 [Rhodoblastus sp.]|nr:MAG: hypothetical protein HZY79_00505 [Rhodoblastus sp.]
MSDFSRLDPEVGDFLDSLQPLAAEIGVATTLEIVRLFGGARLYVPRRWTPDLEFNALGEAVAGRLCAMFGPERIDIPRMPFTVAALRRYAERLRAQEGLTNGQIARALGLSWRSVTRLGGTASFAAGRRRRRIDERQIDLEELLGTPPSAS